MTHEKRRLSMRKVKEILRLKEAGVSNRQIAIGLKVSPSTVSVLIAQAEKEGLSAALSQDLDEEELRGRLYPQNRGQGKRQQPDFEQVHRELRSRKDVTLQLLWEEYMAENPGGYRYSYFCELFYHWRKFLDPPMRFSHRAGHRVFVDFAGQTVPVEDPVTGEIKKCYVFIAVLGASNYTFARAVAAQDLENWVLCIRLALEFFGGVAEVMVSDNLLAAVKKVDRYEPEINPTFQEMAEHYGFAVIPTRPRKPRDKGKVENAVLFVERQILARLRHHTFFSLEDVNRAMARELEALNLRPFKKLSGCRQSWFDNLEKAALKPLPERPYQFARWKKLLVARDYHIEVEGNHYSAPSHLAGQQVEVRIGAQTVEILHQGRRVASHVRVSGQGKNSTHEEHMPLSHRQYLEWTPTRLLEWGHRVGPCTGALMQTLAATKSHPDQAHRSWLGILSLGERYGRERLEAASARALELDIASYKSLSSLLAKGLDLLEPEPEATSQLPEHENIRGATYYQTEEVSPC